MEIQETVYGKVKYSLYASGAIPGAEHKESGKLSKHITGPWSTSFIYCMFYQFYKYYIYIYIHSSPE